MWNKVQLIGNVGAQPEVRVLDNGNKVAKLRLATSERYRNSDGTQREQTEWHNVDMWGNLADVVDKFIKKGDRLFVEGSLHYRSYKDKDGVERTIVTITASAMKMLSQRAVDQEPSAPREVEQTSPSYEGMPF